MPGLAALSEVDLQGRRTAATLCPLHPEVRAFWTGLATDLCKSYDIDGLLFFNEHNGPLLEALGLAELTHDARNNQVRSIREAGNPS